LWPLAADLRVVGNNRAVHGVCVYLHLEKERLMKRKLVVIAVAVTLMLSTAAVDSCTSGGGTTNPGISNVQSLVDQGILKGHE